MPSSPPLALLDNLRLWIKASTGLLSQLLPESPATGTAAQDAGGGHTDLSHAYDMWRNMPNLLDEMHEITYYMQQRILATRGSGPQSSSTKLQSVARVSLT